MHAGTQTNLQGLYLQQLQEAIDDYAARLDEAEKLCCTLQEQLRGQAIEQQEIESCVQEYLQTITRLEVNADSVDALIFLRFSWLSSAKTKHSLKNLESNWKLSTRTGTKKCARQSCRYKLNHRLDKFNNRFKTLKWTDPYVSRTTSKNEDAH